MGKYRDFVMLLVKECNTCIATNTVMVDSKACEASQNTDKNLVSNPEKAGGIYLMSMFQ